MYEIPYLVIFVFFASLFTILKAKKVEKIQFTGEVLTKLLPFSTFIKIIPVGLAIVFVIINNNDSFYLLAVLGVALLFCMFGDIGMERGLIPGLPLFLVGQIFFIATFLGQAVTIGVDLQAIVITAVVTVGMVVYVVFLSALCVSMTNVYAGQTDDSSSELTEFIGKSATRQIWPRRLNPVHVVVVFTKVILVVYSIGGTTSSADGVGCFL